MRNDCSLATGAKTPDSPGMDQEILATPLGGVLETTLYVNNLETAEQFYGTVLGLNKIFAAPGRQLVFQCQEGVLLIFDPEKTERDQLIINGGAIPFHGARGPGHVAFRVAPRDLEPWRQRLRSAEVPIESEVSWPNGAHSIYFRDPAGNSLEFVTPDLWARPIN